MNDGSMRKGILALSGPLIISFWLRSAFGWIDPIFAASLKDAAGNSIGDATLAAIGLTLPFEFLMIACWVGTSNGLTSRLASAMGADNHEQVRQLKAAARRIIWALNAAFLFVALGVASFSEKMGLDPIVASQFRIYATIIVAGSSFTSFWSILPDSIVKAHHDTRTTMWAGILSSLLNVVLNSWFTFGLGWGVWGIAFSTVIGRLAGLSYATIRATAHERKRKHDRKTPTQPQIAFEAPVRAILSIALPSGMTYVLMALESQIVNFLLARLPNATSQLAAWSIFDRSARFMAMPLIAGSVAMLPLVARRHGEKDFRGIRKEVRVSLLAGLSYVFIFVAPVAFFAGPWVADKLSSSLATEVAAQSAMWILPVSVFAMVPVLLLRAVFDGLQRPKPGLVVALLRTFILVGPLVWLGIRWAGNNSSHPAVGAAWGFCLGVGAASAVLSLWLRAHLRRTA
ncbi:MAG: MATE family efflux transporter [Planctomycetota bacterium]|jgi:Na+-driven multidrug efflux pump|nr:MATE family efflux transporter [Planctomycetota bacterium]MDP6942348.1 MATE family efflux transporter [Planctomycetota bacterium]